MNGSPQAVDSVQHDADVGGIDVYLRVDPVTQEVVELQIEVVVVAAAGPAWSRRTEAIAKREADDAEMASGDDGRRTAIDAILDALGPRVVQPS